MSRSVIADGSATADTEVQPPISEGRKHEATVFLRDHGAAFRATARRFAVSPQDAEDAYQRAAELLLTKAPETMELRARINWMHVVVRHEALRLRRLQRRSIATEEIEELAGIVDRGGRRPESSDPADLVERRADFDQFRQAYRRLKPDEQQALRLIGEGYSYGEIGEMTGWSRTKINRHLAEGRSRMRTLLGRIEGGVRCAELAGPLSRYIDGEAGEAESQEVADHLKSCLACRATAKSYRQIPRSAAALFPVLPSGSWLSERFQTLASWAQSRLPGRESLGEAIVIGSGPTSGAGGGSGLATLVKLAVVCAGAGGGTAACVASGVLPAPIIGIERQAQPKAEEAAKATVDGDGQAAQTPAPLPPAGTSSPGEEEPKQPADDRAEDRSGEGAEESEENRRSESAPIDPVEAEFGLEAGGAAAPPASSGTAGAAAAKAAAAGTADTAAGSEAPRAEPPAPAEPGIPAQNSPNPKPPPNRLPPPGGAGEFGP